MTGKNRLVHDHEEVFFTILAFMLCDLCVSSRRRFYSTALCFAICVCLHEEGFTILVLCFALCVSLHEEGFTILVLCFALCVCVPSRRRFYYTSLMFCVVCVCAFTKKVLLY